MRKKEVEALALQVNGGVEYGKYNKLAARLGVAQSNMTREMRGGEPLTTKFVAKVEALKKELANEGIL